MNTGNGFEPFPEYDIYLSEVSPQDKPWEKHRAAADKVRNLYRGTLFDRYAERISGCSGLLEFVFVTNPEGTVRLKLTNSRFCRVRHCPVCQWRRQLMWRARFFSGLPNLLRDYPKVKFLFLTLTVKNCPVDELRETLAWMNKSWERLSKRKQFPALGWLKATEVTRSTIGYAHPHFHVILAVNPSYFGSGYLSKEKWVQMWRESLRVEYHPSLHIRVVKSSSDSPNELNDELMKGFCEVLKYALKPEDLVSNAEWLIEITSQLHKTRAVAVGGIFKQYISDKEPDDLIGEDENPELDSDGVIWFGWREAVCHYCKVSKPKD